MPAAPLGSSPENNKTVSAGSPVTAY